jgi:uroporphyrinogen-III synthase
VVNTRSPAQAPELDEILRGRGAVPLSYPCIDIAPPEDANALVHALAEAAAGRFDWVVFTSVNAVQAVATATGVAGAGRPAKGPQVAGARVAAVGPGTAAAVWAALGLTVDLRPDEYTAQALAAALVARGLGRVLLLVGDKALDTLPRALEAAGAGVTPVIAYRTVPGRGGADLPAILGRGEVDAVTFTSPSTVDNLALRLEHEGGDWALLGSTCIACIGPVTSRVAVSRGLHVQVEPREHTIEGLVDALEEYFNRSSRNEEVADA